MPSQPDYYEVLRVKPVASQQEISRAYRALMRTHHPDLDPAAGGAPADTGRAAAGGPGTGRADGDPSGGEPYRGELLQIMQAFAVLRDPARRADYDRSRAGTVTSAGTSAGRCAGTSAGPQGAGAEGAGPEGAGPVAIPVRKVHRRGVPAGNTIRISPVHWESGPWA